MSKHRRDESDRDEMHGIRVSRRELVGLRSAAGPVKLAEPRAAAAALTGPYLSPCKGRGMEFDEVRAYQPGDEVRNIDWHVTARTGRAHSKLFSEERERHVLLGLDTSPSMHFGTRTRFKSVAAARAAAVIAWSAANAGDRVGGLVTAAGAALFPPRRGQRHLYAIFDAFSAAIDRPSIGAPASTAPGDGAGHAAGPTAGATTGDARQLGGGLARLRRFAEPGSKVFVISDFYDLSDDVRVQLAAMARYCDVTCILVYDALEQAPPPPGRYRFTDGNRTITQVTSAGRWRDAYAEHFAGRREAIRTHCRRHRIALLLLRADEEPAVLLANKEAAIARGAAQRRARR